MKKLFTIVLICILSVPMFSMLTLGAEAANPQSFQVLWRVPIQDNIQCNAGTGDLNGDGIDDVVAIPDDGHYGQPGTINTMQAIKNDGNGLWTSTFLIEWGIVELLDLDGDGRCEVVVGGTSEDYVNTDGLVYVFDDNGQKLWEHWETIDWAFWGCSASRFIFTDVDSDSLPEIIVIGGGYMGHYIYCLDGDGNELWRFECDQYSDVDFEDVTGDGVEEIILATHGTYAPSSNIYVLNRNGGLIWNYPTNFHGLPWYNQAAGIGDLTGDGINDIAVTCRGCDGMGYANILYTLRNDGTPLLTKQFSQTSIDQPSNPILKDVDGNGICDIIVYAERKINAYRPDGSLIWSSGDFSTSFDLLLFDIDGNGEDEIIYQLGQEVYEVSTDGEITLVGTLANQGRLLYNHSRSHHITSGDVNNDGFDELIISEIIDGQSYVAAVLPPLAVRLVYVDIKPGSWPNPINVGSKGVFAVAICGTKDFDVKTIDPKTVKIYIEGTAEGVSPICWSYEDVATPYTGPPGGGHTLGADGYLDLVFHFDTQAVTALDLTSHVGQTIPLIIKGNIYRAFDGMAIQGQDYVRIIKSKT
jgi:hypothetical protein